MTIMITAEESDYMTSYVKDVIEKFGPRMPCSQAEADAAEYIKQEMETTCNEISIEPFTCSPGGLLGWIKFDIMFIVASFILYLFTPFITREMVIQTIFCHLCLLGHCFVGHRMGGVFFLQRIHRWIAQERTVGKRYWSHLARGR